MDIQLLRLHNLARVLFAVVICLTFIDRLPAPVAAQGCPAIGTTPDGPLNVSNAPNASQVEMAISVDPTNPANQVIAVFNQASGRSIRTYYTRDAGKSWCLSTVPIPSGVQYSGASAWSDPSVAHDHLGRVYVAYNLREGSRGRQCGSGGSAAPCRDAIVVARSTDGGATYSRVSLATDWTDSDVDKPFIEVDDNPQSPDAGNVYVAWTDWGTGGDVRIAKSTDGGLSWTRDWIAFRGLLVDLGIGPGGEVYLVWRNRNQLLFRRYGAPVHNWPFGAADNCAARSCTVATIADFVGGPFAPMPELGKVFPIPSVDVDRSGGRHNGRIWVAYADYSNTGFLDRMDIFVKWSDDEGLHWHGPVQVNRDNTLSPQFNPWLDVDDSDGSVGVIYYGGEQRNIQAVQVYYAQFNGGDPRAQTSWINRRVTNIASNTANDGDIYDYLEYIGLHEQNNIAYLAWTSYVTGEAEVFYTQVPGVNRRGDSGSQAGAVWDIDAISLDRDRVVTAVRDSADNLKVISWIAAADGTVTRTGDSGRQAGAVSEIAVDSLGDGKVVTAVRDSSGNLKLINWSIGDDGSVTRLGSGRGARGTQMTVRALTGSRVVTAMRSSLGTLKLTTWTLNASGTWSQVNESSSGESVDTIAMTSFSTNEDPDGGAPTTFRVVTAVRDSRARLKLIAWDIAPNSSITYRGTSDDQTGWGNEVAIYYGLYGLVTTAGRDASGDLKLITWNISGDGSTITPLFDSGTQAGSAREIDLAGLSNMGVVTAVRTASGNLKLIAWAVFPDGQIRRLNDSGSLAGAVSMVSLCQQTGNRYVTAVRSSNGNLKLISWKVG